MSKSLESSGSAAAALRVIVASHNPVKSEAARRGLELAYPERMIEIEAISAASGVADQPMSDAETLEGARHRAREAERQRPGADFCVGLEGGIESGGADDLLAFAWAVVRARGREGRARTAAFQLPPEVARLVRSGLELGEADDRVFARRGSKRQGGAVGLLTEGRLSRADLYVPAVLMAAVPFLQPALYFQDP
ncbi:MAG: inosine/xanthosine triphosphatase [Acidobacteriota bacterium]